MKKLFAICFLLSAICFSPVVAQRLSSAAGLAALKKKTSAPSLTCQLKYDNFSFVTPLNLARNGGDEYFTYEFTPDANCTLCGVLFYFESHGSPSGNITATLNASAGGEGTIPAGLIATSSNALDSSTIGGGLSFIFDFADIPLTAGTTYCFGVTKSAADSSNYPIIFRATTTGTAFIYKSSDGSTWTDVFAGKITSQIFTKQP